MTELFENIFRAVQSCPVDRLPRVLGMLAEISESCRLRLNNASAQPAPATPDTLLTCAQAAERLQCSRDYLYKTSFSFKRKLGRKTMFSSAGIDAFLAKQK
jgi:hypothetical protein